MEITQRNLRNRKKIVDLLDTEGMDIELLVATEVLKLESLHYGFWDENADVTFENFKKAQARYTEMLIDSIPDGVSSILDVGCGIGDNARALARSGFRVTAISPDRNHGKYVENLDEPIVFHNSTMETFDSEESFDLILLSESQTYFDPKITFRACNRYLNKPGYLLVSDIFNISSRFRRNGVTHTERQYVEDAERFDLRLSSSVDITERVLPSLELAHSVYASHARPALEIAIRYARKIAPVKYWLIKLLFNRQLRKIGRVVDYYEERLSPKYFTDELRYMRLLFHYG